VKNVSELLDPRAAQTRLGMTSIVPGVEGEDRKRASDCLRIRIVGKSPRSEGNSCCGGANLVSGRSRRSKGPGECKGKGFGGHEQFALSHRSAVSIPPIRRKKILSFLTGLQRSLRSRSANRAQSSWPWVGFENLRRLSLASRLSLRPSKVMALR